MMQEFVNQLNENIKTAMKGMHTAFPGTIVSFDTEKGLATVQPSMKFKKPSGETISYPAISGVPVMFPQGTHQHATVAFPVEAGDSCLVIVAEQSIEYWLYDQETKTDLAFDLTNAICIPGLFNKANGIVAEACKSKSVIVDVNGKRVQVKSDGINIVGNVHVAGSITTTGGIVASGSISTEKSVAAIEDVLAGSISLASHKHPYSDGVIGGPI